MSKKRILTLLITVLILGGLLRFFAVAWRGPFRFDEMFTVHFSAYSLKDFSWAVHETNPPLFYLLMHFWLKIFGDNEIVARLPALILGLASIITYYFIGKKMFSAKAGLLAGILVAFSSYQIFNSTEARMYSLLFLLSGLSIYFFWRWISQPMKKIFLLFWLIISILLVYTHLTGCLIILSQLVFFVIFYRKMNLAKKEILFYLSALTILILVFFIWFIPSRLSQEGNSIIDGWFFHTPDTHFYFLTYLRSFINLGSNVGICNLLINLFILVGLFFFFFVLEKGSDSGYKIKFQLNPKKILLLTWLLVPLSIGFILYVNYSVYFIGVSGALYLILSCSATENSFGQKTKNKILPYFIFLLIAILILPSTINILNAKNQIISLTKYIQNMEKPSDKIIVHVFNEELTLQKYYQGNLPTEGFYPLEDALPWDLRIVRKNWQNITTEENVKKLTVMTNGFQRIFLIRLLAYGIDSSNLVVNWFHQNGWQLVEKKLFSGGFDPFILYIFQRY